MKAKSTLCNLLPLLVGWFCFSVLAPALAVSPWLFHTRGAFTGGGGGFTAETATFNGSSHYARLTGAAAGIADGKVFTCSFWMKLSGGDSATQGIWTMAATTASRVSITRNSSNVLSVSASNFAAAQILGMTGSTTLTAAHAGWDGVDGWNHVFICVNLATASQDDCKIYLNGVQETESFSTGPTNDTIDIAPTGPRYTVGASGGGIANFNGALAEFVFYDSFHDIPSSFYTGTKPADIGATGSTPTGSAPDFYFSRNGSGNDWATDSSGTGNTLTPNGTLGSTTAP